MSCSTRWRSTTLKADSWQRVASMPQGLYCHAAAAMGGKIYVTGGYSQEGAVNSVFVYDPQANAWTQLASMGIVRQFHASAVAGGKLYVFGGAGGGVGDGSVEHGTAEVYDPASDSWAQGLSLTSPRSHGVAIAL